MGCDVPEADRKALKKGAVVTLECECSGFSFIDDKKTLRLFDGFVLSGATKTKDEKQTAWPGRTAVRFVVK